MQYQATELTSLANPRVKQVVKLRQRSHRDKLGQFLIEGCRETSRALSGGWALEAIYFCKDRLADEGRALLDEGGKKGIPMFNCSAAVLGKMAYRDNPDGILAVGPQRHLGFEQLALPAAPLIVVAESVEKPGNLGTILRSADGAGVDAVVVCDRCTDIHNPNVVRASMGALFHLPVVETDSRAARQWLREHSIQVVAATPHAQPLYCEVDLRQPIAVVVGTEKTGLTNPWLEDADIRVRIPMKGMGDSLNVASATTLILYEALRQRSTADKTARQEVPGKGGPRSPDAVDMGK